MKLPYNSNSQHSPFSLVLMCLLTLTLSSCGAFKRQNPIHTPPKEAAQTTAAETAAQSTDELEITRKDLAQRTLALGTKAHGESRYADAVALLQGYLTDYQDAPLDERDRASDLLGQSLVASGQCASAIPYLKRSIENSPPSSRTLAVDLLLLADCYDKVGRTDEAIAATHEVVPDPGILVKLALPPESSNRKFRKVKAPLDVQVSALLMRAKFLASKQDLHSSRTTLAKASRLINTARGYGITQTRSRELSGELALRQLQILGHQCLMEHPRPTVGDEDGVVRHLNGYYSCIEKSRVLLCDVHRLSPDLMGEARPAYRGLVEAPRVLAQNLPPPSRTFKDPSARSFYETELKNLVNARVQEKLNDFSSVQECGLSGIL